MRLLALIVLCAAHLSASEVLDPPLIDGWRYSHRAYHAIAGAIIGYATDHILMKAAPEWCHRHPVMRYAIDGIFVVGAGVGKEVVDHHYGSESFHHSAGDVAVTTLGGAVGISLAFRF